MAEIILPASANWYCSKVCDTNEHGDLVFGARHFAYVISTCANPPRHVSTLTGHSDRVTSAVYCKHKGYTTWCCTGADDCCLKLWDSRAAVVMKEHAFHQHKVTVIDWSTLDKDLIVSGDEKGTIICWNHSTNEAKQFVPDLGHIFCLSCSPHDVQYLAVGYKHGNILVVDIGNAGNIIHKLRGHDDEIHSVCWSPTLGEVITQRKEKKTADDDMESVQKQPDFLDESPTSQSSEGSLLVSGSRDRTVRLWSMSKGKAMLTLKLPGKFSSFKGKGEETSKTRVWVALYWPKNRPREILSSSHGGDLLLWDVCKPGKQKWRLLGQGDGKGHNRIIFNVVHGGDANFNTVLTLSMDRQIISWTLASSKVMYTIPTLGGFVYSMVTSPIDPGRLAIGVGDNMIRIWNTSSPINAYDVSVLWQGTRSKVTALCWHPYREGHLAYGTDDGRVGIYDVTVQKPPNISSSYHKKTVYSVGWGPPCLLVEGKSSASYSVYSCGGEGIVLQHNPNRIYEDAEDINMLIRKTNNIKHKIPQRSELSWKPDGSVLALGNEDGSIEIFLAPSLLLLCSIHVHHKIINCLQWYPDWSHHKTTSQSNTTCPDVADDQSNCKNWLAAGSNDPPIHIYDLTDIMGTKMPVKTPITTSYSTLNGHIQRVTGLSWSPHGEKKLASVSYDGTAQVWDVVRGQPVANYRGHHGRLFSIVWSATDSDSVYSGGEDFTLQRWRVSQQEHVKPPKSRRTTQISLQKSSKSKTRSRNKHKQEVKEPSKIKEKVSSLSGKPEQISACLKSLEDFVEKRMEEFTCKEKVMNGAEVIEKAENKPTDKCGLITSPLLHAAVDENDEKGKKSVFEVSMETAFAGSGARRGAPDRKKKKHRSLFPKSSSLDNRGRSYIQEDCVLLGQSLYSKDRMENFNPGTGSFTHMGLFADRRAAFQFFREEGSYHLEQGNLENYLHLEIWKGNIGKALQVAKEQGQLNDWLVSLAPLGGHSLWLQMVEAYANQLCTQEVYIKAVSYYLACHKVYEAINMLKENKLLKEAVAVAKVRLSPSDPVLCELYQTWAVQLENDGNFEQAAKCYLATHQICDAVRLLARRGDLSALRIASQVALYANEVEQASSLALQCANQYQNTADWQMAFDVLSNHRNVKGHQLQLVVHQVLVQSMLDMNLVSRDVFPNATFAEWFVQSSTSQKWMDSLSSEFKDYIQPMTADESWPGWPASRVNNELFYIHILRCWYDICDDICEVNLTEIYKEVLAAKPLKGQLSIIEVLIDISYDITLAILSIMTSQPLTAVNHWLQAITLCHDWGFYEVEQGLFRAILPNGWQTFKFIRGSVAAFKDASNESSGVCPDKESDQNQIKSLVKVDCLHAYYCRLSLYDMWWKKEDPINSQGLSMIVNQTIDVGKDDIQYEEGLNASQAKCHQISDSIVMQDSPSVRAVTGESMADISTQNDDTQEKEANVCDVVISNGTEQSNAVNSIDEQCSEVDSHAEKIGAGRDALTTAVQGEATNPEDPTRDDCPNHHQLGYSVIVCEGCMGPFGDAGNFAVGDTLVCQTLIKKLEVISKVLLSDTHAQKHILNTKLHFLQKAVKAMITRQKKQARKEKRQKEMERKGEQLSVRETCDTEEVKNAESLHLSKNNDGELIETQTFKDFEFGQSEPVIETAEYDDSVTHSSTAEIPLTDSDQTEYPPKSPADQGHKVQKSQSDNADSCGQTGETSEVMQTGDSTNSQYTITTADLVAQDTQDSSADAVDDNIDGEDIKTNVEGEKSHESSNVLPADWKELPLDVRYSHPAVTISVLSDEQTEVIHQLQQLPKTVKELNFPEPVECAMVLVHYCVYRQCKVPRCGLQSLIQFGMETAQWGLKHSQTSQEIKFFLKYLETLEQLQK
ncbi:gem-associated protein 5-like [Glandiceps talaboti]